MKLTQKVDYFTVFESFPSTSCCSEKFPPNKIGNLASWKCEVISGMFTLGGQWEMEWQAKVIVQNDGRAQVKPKKAWEGCWLFNG